MGLGSANIALRYFKTLFRPGSTPSEIVKCAGRLSWPSLPHVTASFWVRNYILDLETGLICLPLLTSLHLSDNFPAELIYQIDNSVVFQEVWPWLWPSQSLSAEIITTETSAPRTTWSTPPRGTAGDTSTATATSALPPTPSVYTAAASPACT